MEKWSSGYIERAAEESDLGVDAGSSKLTGPKRTLRRDFYTKNNSCSPPLGPVCD